MTSFKCEYFWYLSIEVLWHLLYRMAWKCQDGIFAGLEEKSGGNFKLHSAHIAAMDTILKIQEITVRPQVRETHVTFVPHTY